MIRLTQPGSGKAIFVSESAAEFWKSLGYAAQAAKSAPKAQEADKAPAKKS